MTQLISVYAQQEATEKRFNKKETRDVVISELMEHEVARELVTKGVDIIDRYIAIEYSYSSKNERMKHLATLDTMGLVLKTIATILPLNEPDTVTTICGQLSSMFKFDNPRYGLTTAGEFIALLLPLGLYKIIPAKVSASKMMEVQSLCELSEATLNRIKETMYMPPMICKPMELIHNNSSALRTVEREGLILGGGKKSHNKDICLDNLNKFNSVELSLDTKMLTAMSETIPDKLLNPKNTNRYKEAGAKEQLDIVTNAQAACEQLASMIEKSYTIYKYIVTTGNSFYLPHKPDNRGRTYSQGYHVNTQGNGFKKSIIQLAKQEVIEL